MREHITVESIKATPPVAIAAGSTLADISLNQWVAVATIAYIALQAGYLLWKWYKEYKNKNG